MKSFLLARLLPVLLALGLLSGCATGPAGKPTPPPDLQVQVNVPPSWRPMLDDDAAETLASLLRAEFRRSGYTGNIVYLRAHETPQDAVPLLTVNLAEWRLSRTGNAECLFNARLRNATGEDTDLGMVTSTDFTSLRGRVGMGRALELADSLERAALDAMRDLYRLVADTGQVPNLARRAAK